MKTNRKKYAAALILTPAALLAACSTTNDARWSRTDRTDSQATLAQYDNYDKYGDGVMGARPASGRQYQTPQQNSAYIANSQEYARAQDPNWNANNWQNDSQYSSQYRMQQDAYNAQNNPQNNQNWSNAPTNLRNENPSRDNSTSQYNTGVQRPGDPLAGTVNNQNPNLRDSRMQDSRIADSRSANTTNQNWNNSNNWQNQNTSPNNTQYQNAPRPQDNPNWANAPTNLRNENPSVDNSTSQYNTGVQRPSDPLAGTVNNQNPNLTHSSPQTTGTVYTGTSNNQQPMTDRQAAAKTNADPATHPGNPNAQYDRPDESKTAWSSRQESSMDAAGRTREAAMGDISPEVRILSILHVKNQHEIEMGKLAKSNGSSNAVKQFGDQLVSDHTAADAKVVTVASNGGFNLLTPEQTKNLIMAEKGRSKLGYNTGEGGRVPTTNDLRHDGHAAAAKQGDELQGLSGAEFDRVFAQKMVEGHRKLIVMVEQAQMNVSNAQVNQLLNELLPTLRSHEQMARGLPGYTETATWDQAAKIEAQPK